MKKIPVRVWAVLFWLAVWQIAAMAVGQQILLASPAETIVRWLELILTAGFWKSVLFTLGHILAGFLGAVILGALSGALSAKYGWLRELLAPLLSVIKSVPVASFVIVSPPRSRPFPTI